ncbi:hypothetical protein FZEAL_7952 [Fusarium zealandicum]|uniref:Uncharacterized protein n=1 Tax=Fusarium zealandicum TaxID=1053134 RepID=A0A8H4UFH1_9HYPO|nr:hypothetical protein FZEAL_7952 [Fusarium zealandicum]
MSSEKKPQMVSVDELRTRLNDMVQAGAINLGPNVQLKFGDDGLPQVMGPDTSSGSVSDSEAWDRISNIIDYLDSSAGPKSLSWCNALANLCKLGDTKFQNDGRLNISAWTIVDEAHQVSANDIEWLTTLLQSLGDDEGRNSGCERDHSHDNRPFSATVCRLLGFDPSYGTGPDAWENGLADQVLETDLRAYRLIDRTFSALKRLEGRSDCDDARFDDLQAARRHLRRFLKLDRIKALHKILEKKDFLILERKAKAALRDKMDSSP